MPLGTLDRTPPPFFKQGPSALSKLAVCSALALFLMVADARFRITSLSDEFDVGTLLDTDDGLSFRRPGIGPDVLARLRRGQWSIQRQIDLHGMTRDTAREALARFIRQAARDGLRCVRVVHGKGNGSPGREPVLKAKVRAWLVQKHEVIAFAQASAADGGHGALLVVLRGD